MKLYDFFGFNTADFLSNFINLPFGEEPTLKFLKYFELKDYKITIRKKDAKRILLVYGDSSYTFTSKDLSWLSDKTTVIVCGTDNSNLMFIDIQTTEDMYYLDCAAIIKIFTKAFRGINYYIFLSCNSIAFGGTRDSNISAGDNFCITQLFGEDEMVQAEEFLKDLLGAPPDKLSEVIINYSPQEKQRINEQEPLVSSETWYQFENKL